MDDFASLSAGKQIDDQANYQWRVARRTVGNVKPNDFAWAVGDIPEPGTGEVLLKTHYLGLAPVMRFYMQGTGAAGEAVLQPGDVIHGRGVAQVVKSRHPDWQEGQMVQGQIGWQTYKVSSLSEQEKFFPMPHNDLPAALGAGVLGMTGLSAHAGLFACGAPQKGDRMVLSGAAGGVGSMVSQLAANVAGCDVVGIAGGQDKCAFILNHGCSEAIDYKAEDIASRLDALRPDGIDLYFDNVGGETLQACLERLRMHSRIVLCGSISEYTRDTPFGLSNYTRLRATDSLMRGFFVYNHLHEWERVMDDMAGWIHDGKLRPVQDIEQGFENMPHALANLYHGRNVGVQCCSVRGEPDEWL
ncbi:NADP-dependent oxidoreductase [Alterisphingorhabdus coralli]|uniref:NADP-dependent oxidoreductase n=1 Tax=Alterisphingorhabdus coralli TaxID=3071408 RepID=A0AA97I242_9SPHN|nr:NADP-dependent oxidoreductase [Parasphingorhabdus sp. SCSIO 66989]WOE75395.1 NADP-dependent oxidoreductase [Parasphingorhabdus sp. SCSIO 66989]